MYTEPLVSENKPLQHEGHMSCMKTLAQLSCAVFKNKTEKISADFHVYFIRSLCAMNRRKIALYVKARDETKK